MSLKAITSWAAIAASVCGSGVLGFSLVSLGELGPKLGGFVALAISVIGGVNWYSSHSNYNDKAADRWVSFTVLSLAALASGSYATGGPSMLGNIFYQTLELAS